MLLTPSFYGVFSETQCAQPRKGQGKGPLTTWRQRPRPPLRSVVPRRTLAPGTLQPQGPQPQVDTPHMTQTCCPKQTNKSINFSSIKHTVRLHATPVSAVHKARPREDTKSWAEGQEGGRGRRERGSCLAGNNVDQAVIWRPIFI